MYVRKHGLDSSNQYLDGGLDVLVSTGQLGSSGHPLGLLQKVTLTDNVLKRRVLARNVLLKGLSNIGMGWGGHNMFTYIHGNKSLFIFTIISPVVSSCVAQTCSIL